MDEPPPAAEVASMIFDNGTLRNCSVYIAAPGISFAPVNNSENCSGVFQIFNLGDHQSATGFLVAKFPGTRKIIDTNGDIVNNVLAVGLTAAHCLRSHNSEIFCHFKDRDLKESQHMLSAEIFRDYLLEQRMFKVKLLADSLSLWKTHLPPVWHDHNVITYRSDLAAIAIVDETIQGMAGTLEAVLEGRAVYCPAMLPPRGPGQLHVVGYPFAVTIQCAPLSEAEIRTIFFNLAYKTASPVTVVGESNKYLFIRAATQKGHSGSPILDLETKQAFAVFLGGVSWPEMDERVSAEYNELKGQRAAIARRAKYGWQQEWDKIDKQLSQCAVAIEAQTVNHAISFDHPAASALLVLLFHLL
eukprot:TRINITY_DN22749_c0_g1_i2.p1 TRINITY_DN22749_c0_g1~~TRINITY_DN22749_c0_g1_i2.p1  ORF type:complete len:358 (+),score=53.82 TRINITY_DN22749_c0_g1_i2:39-1112(+)